MEYQDREGIITAITSEEYLERQANSLCGDRTLLIRVDHPSDPDWDGQSTSTSQHENVAFYDGQMPRGFFEYESPYRPHQKNGRASGAVKSPSHI